VNDLQINSKLSTMIADYQNSNTSTARLESFSETGPEVGLINDWQGLLNISGLGHSDNIAILQIKNTILLENGTQHSLYDNTWAWVGDEG